MKKNIKSILLIVLGILALISVVSFIYGFMNKTEANQKYASYEQDILSSVNLAVKTCQDTFNKVEATEDELTNLNYYLTNIENAKTPALKAYIASSMVTYTGDYVFVKGHNYSTGLENNKRLNYDALQQKLLSVKSKLNSARNYSSGKTTQK